MRKVVAYHLLSFDGVADAPDRFITDWDDALDANLDRVIAAQDTVILGRRSYDEWATYWPDSDIQPFASFINPVTKYVATSTPLEPEWTNAHVIDTGLVQFVQHLKAQPGGTVGVHASISVTRTLLAAGVVDELVLVIAPAIAGRGRRLFDSVPPQRFELISSAATPSGHLLVEYRARPESFVG